jgi:hypothetical protein
VCVVFLLAVFNRDDTAKITNFSLEEWKNEKDSIIVSGDGPDGRNRSSGVAYQHRFREWYAL